MQRSACRRSAPTYRAQDQSRHESKQRQGEDFSQSAAARNRRERLRIVPRSEQHAGPHDADYGCDAGGRDAGNGAREP